MATRDEQIENSKKLLKDIESILGYAAPEVMASKLLNLFIEHTNRSGEMFVKDIGEWMASLPVNTTPANIARRMALGDHMKWLHKRDKR